MTISGEAPQTPAVPTMDEYARKLDALKQEIETGDEAYTQDAADRLAELRDEIADWAQPNSEPGEEYGPVTGQEADKAMALVADADDFLKYLGAKGSAADQPMKPPVDMGNSDMMGRAIQSMKAGLGNPEEEGDPNLFVEQESKPVQQSMGMPGRAADFNSISSERQGHIIKNILPDLEGDNPEASVTEDIADVLTRRRLYGKPPRRTRIA